MKKMGRICVFSIIMVILVFVTGCELGGFKTFSIIYAWNGSTSGDLPQDETDYQPGQLVTVLGNPGNLSKIGYNFGGWNTQSDGQGVTYQAGQTLAMGLMDLVLYPKWQTGWYGMKWVSLGDSITYRSAWQPYVAAELGLVHTNCGIGSTNLAGPEATAFWQDVRLDAVKVSDPDVVTILGGANDIGDNLIGTNAEFEKVLAEKDTDTFKGAYSYIIENLLAWKPTLRLFLMTTTYGHDDGDALSGNTTGLRYADFAQATKDVALFYGLPCIDLHGESGFNEFTNDTYLPDNIHPNEAGGKRMAEVVIGVMKRFNPL
jgi:lysophospholipase L1-like esterase